LKCGEWGEFKAKAGHHHTLRYAKVGLAKRFVSLEGIRFLQ